MTDTTPVVIVITGDETPEELKGIRIREYRWDNRKVIFKRKPNAVPWKTPTKTAPSVNSPLPIPNSNLVNLLHDLVHQIQRESDLGKDHYSDMLVLSAAGSLGHALAHQRRSLTMVHPDIEIIRKFKAEPLGCRGTSRKLMQEHLELYKAQINLYEDYSSVIYRHAPLDKTGLPSSSFDVIIIEQGHRVNITDVIAEACRLARSNSLIALVSYMPGTVLPNSSDPKEIDAVETLNRLFTKFFETKLRRLLTTNERHMMGRFEKMRAPTYYPHFPDFRERREPDQIFRMDKCLMQAKWNATEFLQNMHSWPVMTRVSRSLTLDFMDVPMFNQDYKTAWGLARRRRTVSFGVLVKTAVVRH